MFSPLWGRREIAPPVKIALVEVVAEANPVVVTVLGTKGTVVFPEPGEPGEPGEPVGFMIGAEVLEVVTPVTEVAADKELEVVGAPVCNTSEPVIPYAAWQATRSIPCELIS